MSTFIWKRRNHFYLYFFFLSPAAEREYEEYLNLDKEVEELRTANQENEKPNQQLRAEVQDLETRLSACEQETGSEQHETGLAETRLAVLQTRFIANLSHVDKPNLGIKLNFDSMDEYLDRLQRLLLLEGDSARLHVLIRHMKEALADFDL